MSLTAAAGRPVPALVFAACLLVLPAQATTRKYYIAAVEEEWDYAPDGNLVNNDTQTSDAILRRSADRIGSVYLKAMYRQYTDGTFRVRTRRPAHLGLLGPVMHSEVGDTIVVVFRNLAFLSGRNFSVHPHGVQYLKQHEGALYVDMTAGSFKADDGVPPGHEFVYVWRVLPTFAPTDDDEPCLLWAYHSHTSPVGDVDTGVMGAMVTCKRGLLDSDGASRRDVLAEFPIYVDATDEGNSWLFQENLKRCGDPEACRALVGNPAFSASNVKRHINGLMYGNLQGLWANSGPGTLPVVFYFFSLNRDIHGLYVSGQVLTVRGQRTDAVQVYPATFVAAYMQPTYPGKWLLASRVTEDLQGGQVAFLDVQSTNSRHGTTVYSNPRDHHQGAGGRLEAFNHAVLGRSPVSDGDLGRSSRNYMQYKMERLMAFLREQSPALSLDVYKVDGARSYHPLDRPQPWTGHAWWRLGHSDGSRNMKSPNRQYYLAIEDYEWDYGPSGQDLYNGGPLTAIGTDAAIYFTRGPNRIGGKYRKSRYVQYTDATFQTRVSRDASQEHLGMLGPVLEMEVGETVTVTVRNMAGRPYSFFPHGLLFCKDQEGFVYRNPDTDMEEGKVVSPGKTETYPFLVPALTMVDTPCIVRTYHSAVDPVRDVQTGLLGPLLLCQKGQLRQTRSQVRGPVYSHVYSASGGAGVSSSWYSQHRHFFLNLITVNENLSWHLRYNIDTYTTSPASVNLTDPGFVGSNLMHAINGRMFGNLEGLSVCRGQKVAWHLFGVGDRFNMHGANLHGQTLELQGNHLNAWILIPGTALTLTSVPETVGSWSVACRTNLHFRTGMLAKYDVHDCPELPFMPEELNGIDRVYYIAAEEVYHDYAPLKRDLLTGRPLVDESEPGYLFVRNDTGFIGSVYKKARYFRYTDATFRKRFPDYPEDEHLGVLGPVLSAEVGDTMKVVFRNMASRPYSIHPQGVHYSKSQEGARYEDGASPSPGDAVQPGETFVYEWTVPPSAGPGPSDPGCVPWMYYSSVDSVRDMHTGLVGPLLTCRTGLLFENEYRRLVRRDVARQFWQIYFVIDENSSWLFRDNVAQFAPERNISISSPQFTLSNTKFTINGKIFGNVRGMVMREGEMVAFNLLSLGQEFHPVHFHGQTFVHKWAHKDHRGDVLEVFPSTSVTVTMLCDNPGEWLVHCHLGPHATAGMEATYTILPAH